jgi:hypothetical protein
VATPLAADTVDDPVIGPVHAKFIGPLYDDSTFPLESKTVTTKGFCGAG